MREAAARLSALCLLVVLPLSFWTPLNDCFPLPKLLALIVFGGLAVSAGPAGTPPAFRWIFPWGAWVALAALAGPGVTSWWRSLPEAALLILPLGAAAMMAGSSAGFTRKSSDMFVAASVGIALYGLGQALGWEAGSWISPFLKGVASTIGNPDLLGGFLVFPFALALSLWLEGRRNPSLYTLSSKGRPFAERTRLGAPVRAEERSMRSERGPIRPDRGEGEGIGEAGKRPAFASSLTLSGKMLPLPLAGEGDVAGMRLSSFLCGLAVLVIGAAIVATEARAAWLAAAAVVAALAAGGKARRLVPVAAVGLVMAALWLALHPAARQAFTSGSALEERLWTWKVAARAVRAHPVGGWGTGSFRTVFLSGQADELGKGGFFHYTEFAHLEPLHFLMEAGVAGLGLLLWGFACLARAWRASPLRDAAPGPWCGTGAGWVGLAVNGLMSFPLHVPPTMVPAWLFTGMLLGGGRAAPGLTSRLRPGLTFTWAVGVVLAFRLAGASGYLRTGQALALSGHPGEAAAAYTKAAALVPGDVRSWWYSAIAFRNTYEPTKALALAERGLALEPAWAELHLERGMALKALDRLPEAEAAYRESIRCNPGFSHAWNNLGNLLGAQGKLAGAETAQRRALALAPDSPEARRNLAVTLMRLGRKKEARAILEGTSPPPCPGGSY